MSQREAAVQEDGWSSSGRAENDRNKKVSEILRALVRLAMREGDTVVASDSKLKIWNDVSLTRAIQNWNKNCVGVARSPGSALRVLTSIERLANQLKTHEIGEAGKHVTKIVMDSPEVAKLVKKTKMDAPKTGNW